jgi:micrococcal nuclease
MALLALVVVLLATALPASAQAPPAYVTRVVDGDTLYAELGGRIEVIRYIGVNAPVVEHPTRGRLPYANVVREMNRRLVEGKWVWLVYEEGSRDRYGRLMAYVWVGDVFVNAALVHYGYLEAAKPSGFRRYADYFQGLEDGARRDGRGIWRFGDVLAYHRPGGSESEADERQATFPAGGEGGGRVFSAPAPFVPLPSGPPISSGSSPAPVAAPPPAPTAPPARTAGPPRSSYSTPR